jgi:hypothetical protein
VKEFLALSCWQVNGKFSLELMRVFSSMCHGKGLPDPEQVKAFLALEYWQVNGKLPSSTSTPRTLSPVLGWASLCQKTWRKRFAAVSD